jgi:hypothetical protein
MWHLCKKAKFIGKNFCILRRCYNHHLIQYVLGEAGETGKPGAPGPPGPPVVSLYHPDEGDFSGSGLDIAGEFDILIFDLKVPPQGW